MAELKRILLAEDDPRDVELTLTALEEYNLANEVVVVQDGAQALDYLLRRGPYTGQEAGNPAVVFLDIKMPKVDGLEVLRAVRADAWLRTVPVVMLTSSREQREPSGRVLLGLRRGLTLQTRGPILVHIPGFKLGTGGHHLCGCA